MPQLIPAIVSYGIQAATASALGAIGSGIAGAVAGGLIASALQPTQKSEGPRLGDLLVQTSDYGAIIPYVIGSPRIAGQVIWAGKKRETSTTTSSGKGGGQQNTSYTYAVDLLILLTDNVQVGITRIWSDGALIWNKLGTAGATVIASSDKIPQWTRMTIYGGGPTQLPDPIYEAAVGTANAAAYRGRLTVFIEGLQLGSSGQLPNLTFEIATAASTSGAETIFLLKGSAGITDSSAYTKGLHISSGTPVQSPANQLFGADTLLLAAGDSIAINDDLYLGTQLGVAEFCIEFWAYPTSYGGYMVFVAGIISSIYSSVFQINVVIDNTSYVMQSSTPLPLNAWTHIAIVRENTGTSRSYLKMYFNGALQFTSQNTGYLSISVNPGANGILGIGNSNVIGSFADMRWTRGGRVYTGNFTPPTTRLLALAPTTIYS